MNDLPCQFWPIDFRTDYVLPRVTDADVGTFESLAGTSVVGNVAGSIAPNGNPNGAALFRRNTLSSTLSSPFSLSKSGPSAGSFSTRKDWSFATGFHALFVFSFAQGPPGFAGLFFGFANPNNTGAFAFGISTFPSASTHFDDLIGLGVDETDTFFQFFTRRGATPTVKTPTLLSKNNTSTLYFKMGTLSLTRGLYMEAGTVAAFTSGTLRFNPISTARLTNLADLPLVTTQLLWMVACQPPGGGSTFLDIAWINVRNGETCL